MKNILVVCMASLFLFGCSASLEKHAEKTPPLELFNYFDGKVLAWGMVQDRSGNQTRRFDVVIDGTVDNDTLVLDEHFVFDDGEKQRRVWTIKALGNGQYSGTADDVVGEATGQVMGNALHWQYVLQVPVGDNVFDIHFDDWMYLQDERRMFNLASMSKFGFEVGRVSLFFEKQN